VKTFLKLSVWDTLRLFKITFWPTLPELTRRTGERLVLPASLVHAPFQLARVCLRPSSRIFIHRYDGDYYTPLNHAAECGALEVARLLVGAGADVNPYSR
jgi:hypothetical protein